MCHASYLAFGEGVPSDHRAVWMDIPSALLHMSQDNYLVKASTRRLQCADPRVVLRYNTLLHERLTLANAFNPVQMLWNSITRHRLAKAQQVEYKALDHISIDSKRFAKCHCRKIKASNIPWCLQVSRSINRILYWKGLLSKTQGSKIGSLVLSSWAKKAGIMHSSNSLALPTNVIQNYIMTAYRAFNRLKKEPL